MDSRKPVTRVIEALVAQGGFEPPLTPSEGYGFRDRCTNHYTTGHQMAADETVPSLSPGVRALCAKAIHKSAIDILSI